MDTAGPSGLEANKDKYEEIEDCNSNSSMTSIVSSYSTRNNQYVQPTLKQLFKQNRSYEGKPNYKKKKLEHLLIHIFLFILEGGDKHASITNSLIYMICKDLLPLGCTEKQGMRRFLKTVVPMYRPPSRKKV